MANYYILKNDKIVLFDSNKQTLVDTLQFMPQYQGLEILETERPIENFQFADTEEYQTNKLQEERERLDALSLTKREVFLALYKDKGITPEQLRTQLEDPEAQIEFDYANSYFRGNPLINLIGANLGYTSAQMDYLFIHGEFEEDAGMV